MTDKLWIHKECNENDVLRLSSEAGISRLLAGVFVSRGISDASYVREFLAPDLSRLHSPFLMKDMDKAVDRIKLAVKNGERILIYGDYDVDGVTSTAMLLDFLSALGAEVDYYIPDRFDEGYGLSDSAVDNVLKTGAEVVVTVDCGITAFNEIKRLNDNRLTVIVTDHHECKDELPEAFAVVNPHRPDCNYPFKNLAGVGVVFKLVQGLCNAMGRDGEHLGYLDLAALGTVADVVQLLDENRVIVKYGLDVMGKTCNTGLKALLAVAGLKDKPVSTYGAGFALAPRINAAGRTGSAARAVKLFTTRDMQLAEEIAAELDEANRYRQKTEMEILQQAIDYVETNVDLAKEKVIVAAGLNWHHGIIGIVASKITERYYRPTILISEEDGTGRGSGRSIEGFNLFRALTACGELLVKYGGHDLAAGLSLDIANLEEFRKRINAYADMVLLPETLMPRIRIDSCLKREDITVESVAELDSLSPYGPGNPCPVFSMGALKLRELKTVGDGRHLKLKLGEGPECLDAIAFNMGEDAGAYLVSDLLDTVFSLEINTWNNSRKVQLMLKGFRLHKAIVFGGSNDYNININAEGGENPSMAYPEEAIPERSDLAAVYQYIRSIAKKGTEEDRINLASSELSRLPGRISDRYRVRMNQIKLAKCLEIFEELKLLEKRAFGDNGITIALTGKGKDKVNLEDSPLYKELQGLKQRMAAGGGGASAG